MRCARSVRPPVASVAGTYVRLARAAEPLERAAVLIESLGRTETPRDPGETASTLPHAVKNLHLISILNCPAPAPAPHRGILPFLFLPDERAVLSDRNCSRGFRTSLSGLSQVPGFVPLPPPGWSPSQDRRALSPPCPPRRPAFLPSGLWPVVHLVTGQPASVEVLLLCTAGQRGARKGD